jgi:hypothetical protein
VLMRLSVRSRFFLSTAFLRLFYFLPSYQNLDWIELR